MNDVIVTLHCVSCRVGSLQLFGSSDGTFENISTKFTHTYHRNDSTSLGTIHFIYILVLEDVIGSDVGDGFYWPTLYKCRILRRLLCMISVACISEYMSSSFSCVSANS